MRKKLMLMFALCLSATWLMAQAPTSGAPAGSSGQNPSQAAPAQPASPATPSGQAAQSAPDAGAPAGLPADVSITEGCLGGAQPNYTVKDKKGTTYKLVTPPNADVSILARHIGEPIAVLGKVNNSGAGSASSGSVAGGANADPSSSNQPSIQVMKIGRGSGNCPAAPGAASPKSPAKQ